MIDLSIHDQVSDFDVVDLPFGFILDLEPRSTEKNQNTGKEETTFNHRTDAMRIQEWWYDKFHGYK